MHADGFVADTDRAAQEAFYPGWAQMFGKIGAERGWPSTGLREQFEARCGPFGAYLIGSPETVAAKALAASSELGAISRLTFQMSSAMQEPDAMQRSITLLGTEVIPRIKAELARTA